MNTKSVISLCLSVSFVMGEHTRAVRKFPAHNIVCMCGLIITFSVCSALVVWQYLQVVNCLCYKHKMNTAMNNLLLVKKEWLEKIQNILCNILLVSFELGPAPKVICATKPRPRSWPWLWQTCDVRGHVTKANFFHTVHHQLMYVKLLHPFTECDNSTDFCAYHLFSVFTLT
jgi:hypothetical protein